MDRQFPRALFLKVLSKPIQYQIMMDTFDTHYDVKMKELICPEYNENKFIDVNMVYVLNNDYKYNTIWGRYFNIWWIKYVAAPVPGRGVHGWGFESD